MVRSVLVNREPTAPATARSMRACARAIHAGGCDVAAEARAVGMRLSERIAMPANNLTPVFRRG